MYTCMSYPLMGPVLTARNHGARLAFAIKHQNWHRYANDSLCYSQMRAGSPCEHTTEVKEFGEAVENVMLPVISFRMTTLVVGQ